LKPGENNRVLLKGRGYESTFSVSYVGKTCKSADFCKIADNPEVGLIELFSNNSRIWIVANE